MDETSIWSDMVADTTVGSVDKRDILIKTTCQVRVSRSLAAKGDRTKMKPFIVFAAAKCES